MRLYMDAKVREVAESKVETREDGLITYNFNSVGRKGTYVPTLIQGLTFDEAITLNEELGGGCYIEGHIFVDE